ncbi:CHAP domain-containing protein [Streptomyces roseoverticillatus]|uniref:CHAP domain-containing protein n=1 Tax=Streptomyces roseoverticillatus TaxID=66429 RepID=UPI0004C011E7|nr:CHAP domain-containing protein [Streptomyces roseoverticillatus]
MDNRRVLAPVTAALLVLAGATAGPALAAAPPAARPHTHARTLAATEPDAEDEAAERQRIVGRTTDALTTPKRFRLKRGGPVLRSVPGRPDQDTNYLGKGRSNANMNEYNDFARNPDHSQWCGFFAAAMWGRRGIPADPGSSRAWRTGTGGRWHPYAADRLPRPGDVLMWAGRGTAGHVGVVAAVSGTRVTTVEGNTGYHNDSIARQRYEWTGAGPVLRDRTKTIQGFASRF